VDEAQFRKRNLDSLDATADIREHLNGFVKPYDVVTLMTLLPSTAPLFAFEDARVDHLGTAHLLLLSTAQAVAMGHVVKLLRVAYHDAVAICAPSIRTPMTTVSHAGTMVPGFCASPVRRWVYRRRVSPAVVLPPGEGGSQPPSLLRDHGTPCGHLSSTCRDGGSPTEAKPFVDAMADAVAEARGAIVYVSLVSILCFDLACVLCMAMSIFVSLRQSGREPEDGARVSRVQTESYLLMLPVTACLFGSVLARQSTAALRDISRVYAVSFGLLGALLLLQQALAYGVALPNLALIIIHSCFVEMFALGCARAWNDSAGLMTACRRLFAAVALASAAEGCVIFIYEGLADHVQRHDLVPRIVLGCEVVTSAGFGALALSQRAMQSCTARVSNLLGGHGVAAVLAVLIGVGEGEREREPRELAVEARRAFVHVRLTAEALQGIRIELSAPLDLREEELRADLPQPPSRVHDRGRNHSPLALLGQRSSTPRHSRFEGSSLRSLRAPTRAHSRVQPSSAAREPPPTSGAPAAHAADTDVCCLEGMPEGIRHPPLPACDEESHGGGGQRALDTLAPADTCDTSPGTLLAALEPPSLQQLPMFPQLAMHARREADAARRRPRTRKASLDSLSAASDSATSQRDSCEQVEAPRMPRAFTMYTERGMAIGVGQECDVYIVHSPRDDAAAKHKALSAWELAATQSFGHSPRVWIDALCSDPSLPPLRQLEFLPYFLSHSRTLLILWGPAVADDLRCVTELVAWNALGRSMSDVTVLSIARGGDEGRSAVASVDAFHVRNTLRNAEGNRSRRTRAASDHATLRPTEDVCSDEVHKRLVRALCTAGHDHVNGVITGYLPLLRDAIFCTHDAPRTGKVSTNPPRASMRELACTGAVEEAHHLQV